MRILSKLAVMVLLFEAPVAAKPPWNIPKEDYGGAVPRNVYNWYDYNDYPFASQRAGEQGYVTVAFDIGVNGRMSNCRVIRSSGYARLDAVPCDILPKRARFRPAKDANGVPIPTHGSTSMAFWSQP